MYTIVNPQQARLFDPFDPVLTERTRKRLLDGWPGVFRHVILELMPVDAISGHFDPVMGRPTKELYSMAGLILLMEWMDWTKEQALDAYSFNMDVHYALNLEPVAHDISKRTLERDIKLFEEDDLAKATLDRITATLIDELGIKIDQQRLDSTHIFSDMASFGRTRLMGVAIKRFLTQVIRDNQQDYLSLDESLRQRYACGVNQLFADTKKDRESRRLLRQQVAEDMYDLIRRFADMDEYTRKNTYKALERIFYEQCDVSEDKVSLKPKDDDYAPLNIDDFNVDEATEEVICCPAGHPPQSSEHNHETGKTKTVMPETACSQCEFFEQCPVKEIKGQYQLDHTAKERRTAGRRREQDTEVFRERYKTRGGIEGTNSGLKRKTGLGQLRVRGRPAVFHAIYLKIAGWNISRAAACTKMREIVHARANAARLEAQHPHLRIRIAEPIPQAGPRSILSIPFRPFTDFSQSHAAA